MMKLRWISIREKLPQERQIIITLGKDKKDPQKRGIFLTQYNAATFQKGLFEITHWIPLPSFPEENQRT